MSAAEEIVPGARIIECSEEQYFADPCEAPSLSQSIGHKLVSKSAVHAWADHPKLGKLANSVGDDQPDEDEGKNTDAIIAGKIIHKLLLGKGAAIEVIDAKDFRTNYAKAARDAAKAAGRIPIIAHKYQELVDAAEFNREQLAAEGYPLNGESEVAFQWYEQGERGPVVCRCRMDHVFIDDGVIYDIKKIRSAHPDTIDDHIYKYGYDIQDCAYKRALSAYRQGAESDMVFLFMEDKPPYVITPTRMSPAFLEIGRQRWERAIFAWEKCLATNRWPKYVEGVHYAEPRPYVLTKELGNGEW